MGNECSIVLYAMRLFVAVAAILTISSCTDKPRPRIEVTPMRCDIGHVQPLTEGRAHFDIKNTGDDHLDISEAKSECGCTASDFKPTRLKPGGTLPLDVTIDTSMKQGAVVKDMAIYSNDPEQPMVRIYIDMFVEDPHKAGISEADMHAAARKIFTAESCRRCHVDEGMGLMGRDLFEADCAMCHRAAVRHHIRSTAGGWSPTHRCGQTGHHPEGIRKDHDDAWLQRKIRWATHRRTD